MATVVIDPGHGGTGEVGGSAGNHAVGPVLKLKEKDLTLAVAAKVEAVLSGRGHHVMLTRDRDVNLSLQRRAKVAKDLQADVFVSVHFNASDKHNAQGTETFVGIPARPQSEALCRAVQIKLVGATGLSDRNASHGGVKRLSLGVLRTEYHDPRTACVLTEVSFLDRADEEQRLSTDPYLTRVATAIGDGIDAYLNALAAPVAEAFFEDAVAFAAHEADTTVRAMLAAGPPPAVAVAAGGRSGGGRDTRDTTEFQGLAFDPAPPGATVADAVEDPYEAEFAAFLATLNLRNFQPGEFLTLGSNNVGGPCAGKNQRPPRTLWANLSKTALMLDEIRRRLNAPVHIHSVYRSPDYNKCIKGKPKSLHLSFNAIDWHCETGSSADWLAVARDVRASNPLFHGGIGHYPGRFVHIDTRGTNVDWVGPG